MVSIRNISDSSLCVCERNLGIVYSKNKSTDLLSEYQKIIRTVICTSYISKRPYLMLEKIWKIMETCSIYYVKHLLRYIWFTWSKYTLYKTQLYSKQSLKHAMSWGNTLEFGPLKVSNGEYLTHENYHHKISIAGRMVYFQV